MPTINTAIVLAQRISARCRRCGRTRELPLTDLAGAGHGDTALADLPLRCTGAVAEQDGPGTVVCGSREMGFIVVPRHTGPRR